MLLIQVTINDLLLILTRHCLVILASVLILPLTSYVCQVEFFVFVLLTVNKKRMDLATEKRPLYFVDRTHPSHLISCSVFLVRKYSPTFTIRPAPVNHVMAGGDLNITCVAVGSPMPYVRWSRYGEGLGDPSTAPIGRNVLALTNIQESANYTCRAASELGTIELTTEVRVEGE